MNTTLFVRHPAHRPSHAENAVKLGSNKGDSGLSGGLGKELTLHNSQEIPDTKTTSTYSNLKTTDLDSVLGDKALHGARAVLDGERRAIRNVGRAAVVVVLVVDVAGNVSGIALLLDGELRQKTIYRADRGGHPQVAGSSVEHDVEGLGRGANGDGAVVLGLPQQ
jgi:hypothetical protein